VLNVEPHYQRATRIAGAPLSDMAIIALDYESGNPIARWAPSWQTALAIRLMAIEATEQ
jgi:hypothetical protein